ncbi:hypothetical protein [Bacillus cereus]|uniref:hypothetical protein n=1 Tax=Bacillus cereus TaxID=1396 RepID=UPI00077AF6EE|nr:hypothetical protein [Bacillus cereus]KXY64611.1 hypothetical protein AT275_06880 [Bacillus cereus]
MFESEEVYINEVEKYKKFTYHQDLLIFLSKKGYQAAKVKLGQSKQELVLSISLNYLGEGLSFLDIISEANIGLMEGIEKINDFSEEEIDKFLEPYIELAIQIAISNFHTAKN